MKKEHRTHVGARTARLIVRLLPEELTAFEEAAVSSGSLSTSDWARRTLFAEVGRVGIAVTKKRGSTKKATRAA